MKKIILFFLLISGLAQSSYAGNKEVTRIKMGESIGCDSSARSGRRFDKKLVLPKGAWGVGLQAVYLNLNSSNSQAFMILTGFDGGASLLRVAPEFTYSYANNHALGLRLGYSDIGVNVGNATISALSDDLKFSISGVNTNIRTYSAGIFNRTYFGIDGRGRFSLYAEFQLGYAYSRTTGAGNYSDAHDITLSFSPGFEAFVLNELSFRVSLGMADIGYETAGNHKDGVITGRSESFKAQARLNLADLIFGLTYYF